MLSTETHLRFKDKNRLKVKGWKNIFHANSTQKRARVARLISDKTDNTKIVPRDKGRHCIMINIEQQI